MQRGCRERGAASHICPNSMMNSSLGLCIRPEFSVRLSYDMGLLARTIKARVASGEIVEKPVLC